MAGTVMLRDAPGPSLLRGLRANYSTCTNETLLAVNLIPEVNDPCTSDTPYDFSREFPACSCSLANCTFEFPFCENGTGSLPTERCVYGDRPVNQEVLSEVCSERFLGLFDGDPSCESGLHNNFQVSSILSPLEILIYFLCGLISPKKSCCQVLGIIIHLPKICLC